MRLDRSPVIQIYDYNPGKDLFLNDVISGLTKPQKEIPSKYFYDKKGSHLFERICALDEYYIPQTEIAIMQKHIGEIVESLGPDAFLIEYGCGDCTKTRILIQHMKDLAAYVPIDISGEQLEAVVQELSFTYKGLEILPVCADYTCAIQIPIAEKHDGRRVIYFPGSSIGNFHPLEAQRFLQNIAGVCGLAGGLLIGVDLKKDPRVLHHAYTDRERVTADFNLNVLERINGELGGDFNPGLFEHYAFYNPEKGRIEMHLVSLEDQTVHLGGEYIHFAKGESIWTESSYKYTLKEFERLAAAAGFRVEQVWTDEQQWFSVQYLVNTLC